MTNSAHQCSLSTGFILRPPLGTRKTFIVFLRPKKKKNGEARAVMVSVTGGPAVTVMTSVMGGGGSCCYSYMYVLF